MLQASYRTLRLTFTTLLPDALMRAVRPTGAGPLANEVRARWALCGVRGAEGQCETLPHAFRAPRGRKRRQSTRLTRQKYDAHRTGGCRGVGGVALPGGAPVVPLPPHLPGRGVQSPTRRCEVSAGGAFKFRLDPNWSPRGCRGSLGPKAFSSTQRRPQQQQQVPTTPAQSNPPTPSFHCCFPPFGAPGVAACPLQERATCRVRLVCTTTPKKEGFTTPHKNTLAHNNTHEQATRQLVAVFGVPCPPLSFPSPHHRRLQASWHLKT